MLSHLTSFNLFPATDAGTHTHTHTHTHGLFPRCQNLIRSLELGFIPSIYFFLHLFSFLTSQSLPRSAACFPGNSCFPFVRLVCLSRRPSCQCRHTDGERERAIGKTNHREYLFNISGVSLRHKTQRSQYELKHVKVQGSLLFVTYTIIQGIIGSEMLGSLHLTHPKHIRTWSSGQPLYGARGAVRGSVPCSRALQSQFLPARDSNLRTSGYRPDSLTIRPRLPLNALLLYSLLKLTTSFTFEGKAAHRQKIFFAENKLHSDC